MKSFINRKKSFYLDNDLPSSKSNILIMNENFLSKEELYLWSWCECYLRYLKLINEQKIKRHSIIKTEYLYDANYLQKQLSSVDLVKPKIKISTQKYNNSNLDQGHGATHVKEKDIEIFEKFKKKIPDNLLNKIEYLKNYNPQKTHKF